MVNSSRHTGAVSNTSGNSTSRPSGARSSGKSSSVGQASTAEQSSQRPTGGPEGNSRLTGMTAALLFVLLAGEGVTILSVQSLFTPHVVIGMILVPVVLVKMGTTIWRMASYYLGTPAYVSRGAPPLLLRLLGPLVVLLTVEVFLSGILLLFVPSSWQDLTFLAHKAGFVLWFGVMVVHVLGHLFDTTRLAPADLFRRSRAQVRGAGMRLWTLAGSLVVGAVLAVVTAPSAATWLTTYGSSHGG